jgi:alginate O-acetyltransferase complex protein AlgI
MLFNSLSFALFFVIVFICYWFLAGKNLRLQNLILLVASYFFYACWDWRFLFLLLFSTSLDFYTGAKIFKTSNRTAKLCWLWVSIVVNLGFLGLFKYYNFFAASFAAASASLGLHVSPFTLKVILPVGISFYTFHGLSYVIDIYKDRIKAESNFIDYSLFVSFFPLLVAGPIERATHLLPQLKSERTFDFHKAADGARQFLWGLFKKAVIADQSSEFANVIFDHSSSYSGSTLVLGVIFFAFQIYCDFSGYSDMALGIARLLGIDLLRNFAFPYFSRDIAEFWRRWHISLSSWFRDYVYLPLGGSRCGTWKKVRNVFIIFLISGFWHGANWTFIAWGLLNAIYITPSIIFKTNRANLDIVAKGRSIPTFKEVIQMLVTFALSAFAWIFFRATSVSDALQYVRRIFSKTLFTVPQFDANKSFVLNTLILIVFFVIMEWNGRENEYAIATLPKLTKRYHRLAFYCSLVLVIYLFIGREQQFIYFQF